MIDRRSSGGPWEEAVGYSRAVRAGDLVLTAGCTSVVAGEVTHPGDAYRQALAAFDLALVHLGRLGVAAADVIQTRMYLVDLADAEAVGQAHAERFANVRPVATMVQVAGLVDPLMRVEVEVVGYRPLGSAEAP
jgi:enamine deaminase RidA (YjgF/YER057c/UK114 family)